MKKILAIALMVVLLILGTGCNKNEAIENDPSIGMAEGKGGMTSINDSTTEGEYVFGKVKSIVGNEIELMVAKMPEIEEIEELEEGSYTIVGGGTDFVQAVKGTPPDAKKGMDLDFTGEAITFTIPAGVTIRNFAGEAQLSAIKAGSIIAIIVDDLESLNVSILEIIQ